MTILRIRKKQQNFVILDKRFLQDPSLSWKAKGLLAYLLSLPDNWKVMVKVLVKQSKDGRDATYNGLEELKKHRYIIPNKVRGKNGRFIHFDYEVYETPQTSPLPDFPEVENPDPEKQTLLSNKELSIDETKETATEESKSLRNEVLTGPAVAAVIINNKKSINAQKNLKTAKNQNSTHLEPRYWVGRNMPNENIIGSVLTDKQLEMTRQLAEEFSSVLGREVESLSKSIQKTLLDPFSFTHAGRNFLKKLHTIKKTIRQGDYVPEEEEQNQHDKVYQQVKSKIQTLDLEKQSFQRALSELEKMPIKTEIIQSCLASYQKEIIRCEAEIEVERLKLFSLPQKERCEAEESA